MKTFVYVPEAVKKKHFEGQLVLRKPTFDEKYELLEKYGGEIMAGGASDAIAQIKLARGLVKESKKFYEKVELKKVKTGDKFSSFDDMSLDEDCHEILMEVAKEVSFPKGVDVKKKRRSAAK